jgi:hypothetical protein
MMTTPQWDGGTGSSLLAATDDFALCPRIALAAV